MEATPKPSDEERQFLKDMMLAVRMLDDSKESLDNLRRTLEDNIKAAKKLGNVGSEVALNGLLKTVKDSLSNLQGDPLGVYSIRGY